MKLLFDCTGPANNLQPGWTKARFYDRGFYNVDRTSGVKDLVQAIAAQHTMGPLIWDIEDWKKFERYEDRFIEIVDWARQVRPELRQGFYSVLPARDYWGPVQHAAGIKPNGYEMWIQQNARFSRGRNANGRFESRGLADAVDFVSPSLYTPYSNDDGKPFKHEELWHEFAKMTIDEARKYQKPIYPWVMPRFSSSAHPKHDPMSSEAFVKQLETVLKHADGVIIFDDYRVATKFDCEPIMQAVATNNENGIYN